METPDCDPVTSNSNPRKWSSVRPLLGTETTFQEKEKTGTRTTFVSFPDKWVKKKIRTWHWLSECKPREKFLRGKRNMRNYQSQPEVYHTRLLDCTKTMISVGVTEICKRILRTRGYEALGFRLNSWFLVLLLLWSDCTWSFSKLGREKSDWKSKKRSDFCCKAVGFRPSAWDLLKVAWWCLGKLNWNVVAVKVKNKAALFKGGHYCQLRSLHIHIYKIFWTTYI